MTSFTLRHMRSRFAGSLASTSQKLLIQSTPRVFMMSSYTAFTRGGASLYSMGRTRGTVSSLLLMTDPMVIAAAIVLVGLAVAVLLAIAAVRRWRRWKIVGGTMLLGTGALTLAVALVAASLALNLFTYARLTHEQLAAHVTTRELGERRYAVTLQVPREPARHYDLAGDEWQIDARVLKW